MHPRVLIVGTVPYNTQSTSRAFEAYFHNWEKENLAQIFSNTKKPCKGHCGTLYQITDYRMLKRWLNPGQKTGKIFFYDELEDQWKDNSLEIDRSAAQMAYKFGRRHTAGTHLLRGILWRKRFWNTPELNKWLDDFQPQCVFLSFSNDYFIPQIALYVAKRFDIPIVSSIGDDYFFDVHPSVNPVYHLYKATYRALIRKVLAHRGSAIYISDKIRNKYNSEFGLDGDTVYLTSTIERKPWKAIDRERPVITYFGNIRMGRNESLCAIADALQKINPSYRIEVYSNEPDAQYYSMLQQNPGVIYGGTIPYEQVRKRMGESDITIIVEGFLDKDVEKSRYSLSTKAADALASGAAILAYGSDECGIIEYMRSTGAAAVCSEQAKLEETIRGLIDCPEMQKAFYVQAVVMTKCNHNLASSCAVFENVVLRAMGKEKKNASR